MKKKYLFFFSIVYGALVGCGGSDTPPVSPVTPKYQPSPTISHSVINTYPHDTGSYTQGLIIYNDELFEGTGEWGHSRILKVDIPSGKTKQQVALEDRYFGEGITILRDTVYQLTWRENTVFVYTLPDFKKINELPIATEGWGITTDGQQLIVSDGTSNIYFYEPGSFKRIGSVQVKDGDFFIDNLNELEYIDGYIYANRYTTPFIYKINPSDGTIAGRIDLSEEWRRIKAIAPEADVPNGIAYDEKTKKIYITGKKWPELYEIQLGK